MGCKSIYENMFKESKIAANLDTRALGAKTKDNQRDGLPSRHILKIFKRKDPLTIL